MLITVLMYNFSKYFSFINFWGKLHPKICCFPYLLEFDIEIRCYPSVWRKPDRPKFIHKIWIIRKFWIIRAFDCNQHIVLIMYTNTRFQSTRQHQVLGLNLLLLGFNPKFLIKHNGTYIYFNHVNYATIKFTLITRIQ